MNLPQLFHGTILVALVLVLAGCNEMEPEKRITEGQAIDFGDQPLVFSIFEIVTVDLGEGDFTDGEIEGTTLEGQKIPLILQNNTLTFMVPKLNQGYYKLVFQEKKKPFNISFEVKPHTLNAPPSGYVESLVVKSQEKIKALERTKNILSPEKKALLESDLAILKKQNEELFAKVALLKESELADLAYFIEANQEWLDEVTKAFEEFNSVIPNGRILNEQRVNIEQLGNELMQKFPVAVAAVVKHIPKIATAVTIGFVLGSIVPVIGNSAGAAIGLGLSIGNLLADIKELFAEVDANAEFVRVVADQVIQSSYKVDYVFQNGVDYELFVSRNYRTLYKGDENSAIPIVKNYLSSFSLLLSEWQKIKSKLPIELAYQPTNPATVQTFNSKSFLIHSDHLSVVDISNPKVTNSVKKDGGRLMVIFNTSENSTQTFQFKINYDNLINGKLSQLNDAALTTAAGGIYTDPRDGNVYKTIKIGNQTWFAENLRYAGSIPEIKSFETWRSTTLPAWAYYGNNPNNNNTLGKMYNGYAVQAATLCPTGWRIPTKDDWLVLINFLGGQDVAGGKMKTVLGWNSPNVGATNESGFSGLPGGNRFFDKDVGLGQIGSWWGSTPNEFGYLFTINLYRNLASVGPQSYEKEFGWYCRCIKE